MVESDYYFFYLKAQKNNFRLSEKLYEVISTKMSFSLFDQTDPRNLIKKCPFCQEIWFKVEGCDGTTSCGEVPVDKKNDIFSTNPFKYSIKRTDGVLKWFRQDFSLLMNKVRDKQDENKNEVKKAKPEKKGCGQRIVWKNLPKLPDQLILELFKVNSMEDVKNIIKGKEEFKKMSDEGRNKIDSTFYD